MSALTLDRPAVVLRRDGRPVQRLLDVAGSCLLLVLLLPLLLVIAAVVAGGGGVLFRQTRVGRDGVPFTMLKFRTMRAGSEALRAELRPLDDGNGMLFKVRRDPRVTRAGRVLRRLSLDELPQLVNVLRGDMSLVGPRPALPDEVARYTPLERRRLLTRPGMTGLWQVSGRSDLSWEQSVRLDLQYVHDCSLALDLRILVRTVAAVVGGRGAY